MDERVLCLLQTFAEIERELGAEVFDGVIERARLAVAAEVMVEAERRAIRGRRDAPPGGGRSSRSPPGATGRARSTACSREDAIDVALKPWDGDASPARRLSPVARASWDWKPRRRPPSGASQPGKIVFLVPDGLWQAVRTREDHLEP